MKKIFILIMFCYVLVACTTGQPQPTSTPRDHEVVMTTNIPQANMPNPASAYCEQHGYRVEIRTAADGSQSGVCFFPDGSECDEWAYFRGECSPASTQAEGPTLIGEIASDGCKIYRNETLGYSFHYPADAQIFVNDDPLKSISVEGPQENNEYWPQFTISHPRDREDFRPPLGVNLDQWLADHNLLGDIRMPNVQIAGTTAIHLRHNRSPQSYAYDRYFFAKDSQLYMILIGHAGDKEDWNLYDHFLESFLFGDG